LENNQLYEVNHSAVQESTYNKQAMNQTRNQNPPSFSEMLKFSENPYPGTGSQDQEEGEWSDAPKDSEASQMFRKDYNTIIVD